MELMELIGLWQQLNFLGIAKELYQVLLVNYQKYNSNKHMQPDAAKLRRWCEALGVR